MCLRYSGIQYTNQKEIFSACTHVENLWLSSVGMDVVLLLAHLPLKRLSADPRRFSVSFPPGTRFSQLTHLEITGASGSPQPHDIGLSARLLLLPHPSHLAFHESGFVPIYLALLECCRSLSVLVSFTLPARCAHVAALAQDTRFVLVSRRYYSLKAWQTGVHAGRDYWSRAEAFIAKRRSGEINGASVHFSVVDANLKGVTCSAPARDD
ncbi:hypothetical protein DFH09DRAFT_1327963 [Mycena vulgaris]|nr:hypothetical protein DFH09DRAFT_1327963 [Mycena vulgaris]